MVARPENRFAYMSFHASDLMIEKDRPREVVSAMWIIASLDYPRGRGLNPLLVNGVPLRKLIDGNWFREDQILHGERSFLVQDPDGYLLRFTQRLETKPGER